MKKETPLMKQYWAAKAAHKDKILLFRMGDFFEMFHDDAVTAAPIIGIALTQRNKKSADETPMCGMPHHSISGAINKLLQAGYRIAICDQIEDPKTAKGLVKRAVTRVLSPGMVYDPETIDAHATNYLTAYDHETVSFLEPTTGEAFYYKVSHQDQAKKVIGVLEPTELVFSSKQTDVEIKFPKIFKSEHNSLDYKLDDQKKASDGLPESARRLLSYACSMQGDEVSLLIKSFEVRELEERMLLPAVVLRHLEVFESYLGDKSSSLLHAINKTKTSAGSRLLKQWLRFPFSTVNSIEARLNEVEYWIGNLSLLDQVRKKLVAMGDIERRLGKISSPTFSPKDLASIVESLRVGQDITQFLGHWSEKALNKKRKESLEIVDRLCFQVESSLIAEPPNSTRKGYFLKKGVSSELDELIDLSTDVQAKLLELEVREKEQTGIPSLKIRYNNVFGYYIEVTNAHKDKVPSSYVRKQTLTNAERYVTEELNILESKVLTAKTRRSELEIEIFNQMKSEFLQVVAEILDLTKIWSECDVYTSLAWLAIEHNFTRPKFTKDQSLRLLANRHPVVEQNMPSGMSFVPNDIVLQGQQCLLLTGPNMAGKSTLMRQVALTSILAQMGSFVPADSAELPVFEKIFTRIGSSDFLSEGLSTFMVEMTETAEMLQQADKKSLVVLDEVGRGTSTFDGMSLAQSILEYLLEDSHAMTFFATHYHELTGLAKDSGGGYENIINAHMTIQDRGEQLQFLHTLVPGAANKSYGIQVAKLAGVPKKVLHRADKVLKELESGVGRSSTDHHANRSAEQLSLLDSFNSSTLSEFQTEPQNEIHNELVEELKKMSVQEVTPLEALNKIAQWQQSLS